MTKCNWLHRTIGTIFILALFSIMVFTPEQAFAVAEEAGDDSPRAEQLERDLTEKAAKSPAIALRETVESQMPRPTLPEGKTLIRQVNILGSTLLAQEAIDRIKMDYENKELTAREMQHCADLVTRAYCREGYITSYGYIIPDKLASGILEIMVAEGRVGKIEIEGNKHYPTKLLRKKISLQEGEPFNFLQLNNDIYRINKHQDRKISIVCDPNVQTGVTNITLKVKDRTPLHAMVQFDNYGSEYILYNRYKLFLTHNNITGHDDSIQFKAQLTEGDAHKLFDVDYFLPLNKNWKFELYIMPFKQEDYYYSDNKDTDFEKHARKWYFNFFQTLIDNPNCELSTSYGFVYKDIHWYTGGGKYGWDNAVKKDRFRALMWGIDLNRADKYGRWVVSNDLEYSLGGIWGGSPRKTDETSVNGAGSGYTKNILAVARRQKLFAGIDFISKARWQLSSQTLTGVNCFSVGGIMGVIDNRGYPRAQAPGDGGTSFSNGFSFPPFGIPRDINVPFSKTKWYDAIKIFTFNDWAQAILKSPQTGDKKITRLDSAGWGLTFTVPDQALSMRMDMGWPVSGETPKDGKKPHIWYSLTKGF